MSRDSILQHYLQGLARVAATDDAREEGYYGCLSGLLEQVAQATGRPQVQVRTLPKKTEAGNPDFRLWNGTDHIVGYMEAKQPGLENLDGIEQTEQLQRYRDTFPNLLLTNFSEFRRYREGHLVDAVRLAQPRILGLKGAVPPLEKPKELWKLLDDFLGFSLPRATSAAELAVELAKRTRFLREVVGQTLEEERAGGAGNLHKFFNLFRESLVTDLTPDGFSDLYAQTVTYGLFAARTRADDGFTRRSAFDNIPTTIGVLRDLFRFISLGKLPEQLAWVVDDIAEVLAVADAPGILDTYYKQGKGSDPIVHFYETFLAHYDPQERERRGVYYTPEPVVSYIVRSLHALLKREFGLADGLAAPGVTLLDPAAGTMTFVARAAQEAVRENEAKYGAGMRETFIRDQVLHNYYAFELMVAPYAVGHLKMGFFLEELGHRLDDDERVRFYLTNTLEMSEPKQLDMDLSGLAEESRLAGEVKKLERILVVLGNPPYSGISTNRGAWITRLIEDYKHVDGHPLGEKKHWLQDDYVKFLRFAQWKIDQAGRGVVGMITNHGYLDNPTFRGMRQSLMRSFDAIYLLDLHGSALKREVWPDGSPDENVFDIRQGVAIAFFVKRGAARTQGAAVHHAEVWGTREAKYGWLEAHDVESTPWQSLQPRSESYYFVPEDQAGQDAYRRFVAVTDIFPLHVTGIVTARDNLVIDFDKRALLSRISVLRDPSLPDKYIMEYLRGVLGRRSVEDVENYAWRVDEARRALQQLTGLDEYVVPILYRPFDLRLVFYQDAVVWRTRREVMRHMLQENLALIVPKQNKNEFGAMATTTIGAHKSVAAYDINYYFPLYLYPEAGRQDLFSPLELAGRRPNLGPALLEALAAAYGHAPEPEEIFGYVYAVLYTPAYRARYAEFLRREFPRVPFTADAGLFALMAGLGQRLVELHLLRSQELESPSARFDGAGDGLVGRGREKGVRYDAGQERVWINSSQYFAPVPEAVWRYRVGGYQVCEKWLKDRQDRRLSLDEIRTYCRIVTALGRTSAIQASLDAVYPGVEECILGLEPH